MSLIDTWAATEWAYSHCPRTASTPWVGVSSLSVCTRGCLTVSRWVRRARSTRPAGWWASRSQRFRISGWQTRSGTCSWAHLWRLATLVMSRPPCRIKPGRPSGGRGGLRFFRPVGPTGSTLPRRCGRIVSAPDRKTLQRVTENYSLDLSAPTDARPFFSTSCGSVDCSIRTSSPVASRPGVYGGNRAQPDPGLTDPHIGGARRTISASIYSQQRPR